jgi:CRISPR-associated endonuclease/helicase Cas3
LNGYQFTYPTEPNNENLNKLRQELSIEVIQNIRKNKDKKVFYIEAPTGGGKTNLSMLAAAELLKQHQEISNIYYVFPFTTLITQTYHALKETMGLTEDEIIQLHSKEGFKEKADGEYGREKQNHIDYLFLNFPVALLSHVKFFDVLKTNGKESNYLLHHLANSIVVVDELQSYPPKIWDSLIFFIQNYAHYFNIRFILMSATLPKLDKLSTVAENVCYLTNHKKDIFQNPNFCNRVDFDFSLLDWKVPEKDDMTDFLNKLGNVVIDKSKEYADLNAKFHNSVFTIVEFIYKRTATDFYSVINELAEGFFDEVFVLSGTILEPRRKEIIHFLKKPENRAKKVILITTQVVEAGVDIDMDLGFKDKSLVDSDEQLAGRINRNVNKPACKLYLFNCDNAEVLYKGDDRFNLIQGELAGLDREILKSKDFDKMYDEVMNAINKRNERIYQKGFSDFSFYMQQLNFPEIDKAFQIINQQSTSVYVPMELDVFVIGANNEKRNFTEKEMQLLVRYKVVCVDDMVVSGEKVFQLYERLIKQDNDDFIEAKTELKKLQGIMSQFIFSLMTHSKSMQNLILRGCGEERFGIYYLSHWEEDGLYNYKFGLSDNKEKAILL